MAANTFKQFEIDPKVRSFLGNTRKMLINNRWVESASGKSFSVYDPATGDVLTKVAEGNKEDINRAVEAARQAFESGAWHNMTASERGRLIWEL